MDLKQKTTEYSLRHYKLITLIMVVFTLGLGALIPLIHVDTDPENMLSEDESVRRFHNRTKKHFALSDIVVVGIVNDKDPNGVYNRSSLTRIYELTEFAKKLRWSDVEYPNEQVGVVEVDLLAPSTVDHIGQGGLGEVNFEWLMQKPPETQAEALDIRDKAMSNPLLKGTIVSEDGEALCLYLPLTGKDFSHQIYKQLNNRVPLITMWTAIERIDLHESVGDTKISDGAAQRLLAGYMDLRRLIAFQARGLTEFKSDYVLFSRLLQRDGFSDCAQAVTRALTAEDWVETTKRLDKQMQTELSPFEPGLDQALKRFEAESDKLTANLEAEGRRSGASREKKGKIEELSEKMAGIVTEIEGGRASKELENSLLLTVVEIEDELADEQQIEITGLDTFRDSALQVIEQQRRIWQVRFSAAGKVNKALESWLSQSLDKPGIAVKQTRELDAGWIRLATLYLQSLRGQVLSSEKLTESVKGFCGGLGDRLENSQFLKLDPSADESKLRGITADPRGDEQYHITGLPVAEDTFGYEMFTQMAVSAPLAMVVIFILMLLFFRKLVLVISPMIVAMVSVISTMGLLIGLGYPVHIMSSMIPIFLMPIAVVDSVHILSEFFDLYTKEKGRKKTTLEVMDNLFMPMLYTSLTSAAGFASLALTPIPPVQVFGVFVAIGIMIAWVCTITFVPAYIMMIREKSLENFGHETQHGEGQTLLTRLLGGGGRFTYVRAKPILIVVLIATAVAIYGITRIQINDNPVKWFSKNHPIRRADIELNDHFSGTYMAYLVLDPGEDGSVQTQYISDLRERLSDKSLGLKDEFPSVVNIIPELEKILFEQASQAETKTDLLNAMTAFANDKLDTADEKEVGLWYEVVDFFEMETERLKLFKQPEVLGYISKLQEYLGWSGLVGKSNSIADIVKKVHQELIDGKPASYKIPNSPKAVAECLFQFQSSHNPEDLWHFVTIDYMRTNVWMQLPSGDNKEMQKVVRAVEKFMAPKPPVIEAQFEADQKREKYVEVTAKSESGKTAKTTVRLSGRKVRDFDGIMTAAMDLTSDTAAEWHFKYRDEEYAGQLVANIVEFSVNPPVPLKYDWAGLTYINVVWQDKMVWGMLQSFVGSFIIVFIMMAILFRSPLWGIVCMVPLLITIVVIYGIIGLFGKDYDMPVAVLSALTLGMAVDFAIHFLERARASREETGSWQKSATVMFGEPARAITRNVLVIAIGFLPLLAAPLIPYKTVGIFLCAIMALSGAVTLLVLPAIVTLAEKVLFKPVREPRSSTCNCAFCLIISLAVVVLVAMNLHQYWELAPSKLAALSVIAIPIMALICAIMSRRRACKKVARVEKKVEQE